jgi:hypothetical protein
MSDSRAAGGLDRLPWLADEPVRRPASAPVRRRGWDWMGWGVSTVLVVAGLSFWLGARSETGDRQPALPPPSATVPVPAPRAAPSEEVRVLPAPEVVQTREPEVRVIRVPEVRIVTAPAPKAEVTDESPKATDSAKTVAEEAAKSVAPAASVAAPRIAAPAAPLRPWSPRVVAGASGRLVQIGAYGSRLQAKQGWVKMSRAYPALKRLPAVVAVTRNSRGRLFYRFQIGTTSQAHSEILCQRMQRIDLSCAVVGLPWKSKVER